MKRLGDLPTIPGVPQGSGMKPSIVGSFVLFIELRKNHDSITFDVSRDPCVFSPVIVTCIGPLRVSLPLWTSGSGMYFRKILDMGEGG